MASLLESLKWTEGLARLAWPLVRIGRLNSHAGSAFALAIVSPAAANAYLANCHEEGKLSLQDLVLANLFNSLPANLLHMPTIFFLTWPVLGSAALLYVGITFAAAVGRTIFTILLSRILHGEAPSPARDSRPRIKNMPFLLRLRGALGTAVRRFRKRLPKLLYFTIPFYIIIYFMNQNGIFSVIERWLASHLTWLSIIKPEAMSIVILQMIAEMGASLGAASALLESGTLGSKDIVLAMLAGNILSTPMRAIRHQFPAYAGYYRPLLALKLLLANQGLRACSMVLAMLIFALL